MKPILPILFLLLLNLPQNDVWGQQDPMYTHYMYNTQVINPAYAGSREALTVTGLMRSQWTGFDGNPVTQTLTIHSPLVSRHFGVGVALNRDGIGISTFTSVQMDFAFRFSTGKRSQLAFGLKGGFTGFSENLSGLTRMEDIDPVFVDYQGGIIPNIGTGAYFQHERFYVGVSIPELLENTLHKALSKGTLVPSGYKQRHYYLIAGAIFELQDRIDLKPTLMVKHTVGAPLQIDMTAQVIFYDKLIAGAMFRYAADAGLMIGFNFTEQLMMGYAFDWSFKYQTGRYNSGSHEFAIRYDFLYRNSKGVRSSRYF
jgi:type IX secretion system PorP/SprF family membrane protein